MKFSRILGLRIPLSRIIRFLLILISITLSLRLKNLASSRYRGGSDDSYQSGFSDGYGYGSCRYTDSASTQCSCKGSSAAAYYTEN